MAVETTGAHRDIALLQASINGIVGRTVDLKLRYTTGTIVGPAGRINIGELDLRAEGGPARAGQPYIVGEGGPELFVPTQSGMVVPNGAMMGRAGVGATTNVYVTVQGNAIKTRDLAREIRDELALRTRGARVGAAAGDVPDGGQARRARGGRGPRGRVRIPPTEPRPTPNGVFAPALAGATDRDRLILMLGAYAGLRRSEMAGLRWDQINGGAMRIKGKGGKVRTMPLHSDLAAELHTERQRRFVTKQFGTGWRFAGVLEVDSPYVFPGLPGRHIRPDSLGKAATKALADSGGSPDSGWTAHTLRHRFATRAYGADRDLFAVQRLLGHSRPETTARYADIPAGALEAAVRAAG